MVGRCARTLSGVGMAVQAFQQTNATRKRTGRDLRFTEAVRALDTRLQRLAHRHARLGNEVVLPSRSSNSTTRHRSDQGTKPTFTGPAKALTDASGEGARHGAWSVDHPLSRALRFYTWGSEVRVPR